MSQELGTPALKDMKKDTSQYLKRKSKIWERGLELPCLHQARLLPAHHPPGTSKCAATQSNANLVPLRFLQRLHYVILLYYWLHFQSLPPVWRMEGEAEPFKLLITAWSFCWPAPSMGFPGACQESPHWNRIHSYHPRNSKGFVKNSESQPIGLVQF